MKFQRMTIAAFAIRKWAGKSAISIFGLLSALLVLPACTSVNTFPMIARAGDTVSVMVGGSEQARKATMNVTLTDANGQTWDLKSLGLVRSVFELRADGRAYGMHYSPYLDSDISWTFGHEPVQTVLVTDLPTNVSAGQATLNISLNVPDNSSGIADPFSVKLEIVPGAGSPDQFLRRNPGVGPTPVDFSRLEPAPHAKISFANGVIIGAASLKVSFNSAVLNGNDINVYSPEAIVRGNAVTTGAFGATQRMIYWHQDGQNLYLDIVAPQGVDGKYLKMYVMHPAGLSGSPNFTLTGATVYGIDGSPIATTPALQYFP